MSATYTTSGTTARTNPLSPGERIISRQQNGIAHPMDNRQSDYQQPGSHETPRRDPGVQTDTSSTEHHPAPQYSSGQDPRAAPNFSSSTPTSEYMPPSSARSGQFTGYIQQQEPRPQQYPPQGQGPPSAGLAQPTSPSLQHSAANSQHSSNNIKSNHQVPIDPSIATSPTYPPQASPYSPYQTHPAEMQHYGGQPGVYARPEWATAHHYPPGPPPMPHYGHPATSGPPSAGLVSPGGHPISTVYSFVPIPGAQQHKRPRRRYEEIERMYKCGWQGCEKAYGTLNHLNAHVTMQSHGAKRTPEEFKEIRKEWKQKKKEEEAQRKADEDRHRDNRPPPDGPQLPPIGYTTPVSNQTQPGYGAPSPAIGDNMQHSYPQSPYPPTNQMYQR